MNTNSSDSAVLTVLMRRLAKQRLPRAQALLTQVENGIPLSEYDIAFLEHVLADTRAALPLMLRNPAYQKLYAQIILLYGAISCRALDLEQQSKH